MQWFTRFFPRLPMFFIVLFCIFPTLADADGTIIQSKGSYFTVSYKDADGAEQTLDTSRNRLTALHFWAAWCIPCVKEMPKVNAAQKRYEGMGFQIIPISEDFNTGQVKKFYDANNIDALGIWLDSNQNALQKLKVKGLPTTIFINSSGSEISRVEGEVKWESGAFDQFVRSRTSGASN